MKKLYEFCLISITIITLTACETPRRLYDIPEKAPKERKIENVRVALVLGGGGAKGMAHIGVLQVLEENGIYPDLIVGSSAGSIIGAMYASYEDSNLVYEKLIDVQKWDLIDFSVSDLLYAFSDLRGAAQGYYLEKFIIENIPQYNIEDLPTPYIAVSTELMGIKSHAFTSGPIALAVRASSSIPPVFSPLHAYGCVFVDGGVLDPVPVDIARKYHPKLIIAVDISSTGKAHKMENMIDLTNKAFAASYHKLSKMQSSTADIVIKPKVDEFGMFDDDNKDIVVQRGREATQAQIPNIRAWLSGIKN